MSAPVPPEGFDPIAAEPPTGYQELLGYRLVTWQDGYAEVRLEVDHRHANRAGIVHGGAIASLIDTATGYAGCYCPYPGRVRRAVTLSLTTSFVGQARDQVLVARARQTGGGRNIFFVTAEVVDGTGATVAIAQGTFRYRSGSGDLYGVPADGNDG